MKLYKRIVFVPTPRQREMILALIERDGYRNATTLFDTALISLYNKSFPVYMAAKPKSLKGPEADKKLSRQREIVEALNGKVNEDTGMCTYFIYDGRTRHETEVSLAHMTEDLIETQYLPSKEVVEKLQEQGEVDYE